MYLGLDIGTSSVKVVLIDADQRIVASRSEPLEVERPHPTWSEQDPESWVTATSAAIDALKHDHPKELAGVRGIGLSGHMHGATLIDKAGRPLRPCILWNDGRSFKEAAELDADPRFRKITGNIVFPGFTAPKLVWVHRHEPKIFGKVAKVLLPKDYVRQWLIRPVRAEPGHDCGDRTARSCLHARWHAGGRRGGRAWRAVAQGDLQCLDESRRRADRAHARTDLRAARAPSLRQRARGRGKAVATAQGIELDSDPEALIDHAAKPEVAYDHKASMLQDIEARRPTEVDYLNGGIVRFGRENGVPTHSTRPSWP